MHFIPTILFARSDSGQMQTRRRNCHHQLPRSHSPRIRNTIMLALEFSRCSRHHAQAQQLLRCWSRSNRLRVFRSFSRGKNCQRRGNLVRFIEVPTAFTPRLLLCKPQLPPPPPPLTSSANFLHQVELYRNRLRVLSPLGAPYSCDEFVFA